MKRFIVSFLICFAVNLIIAGCNDSKRSITSLEDVKDAAIGARTGTTGEQLVKSRFPAATVKSFDDIMDAVAALKSGHVDAVITGFPAALNICRHNPDLQSLEEPVIMEFTSIAVKKGNDNLLSELNDFITELKNDGTLQDMRRRWLKTDLSPYEEVEIAPPTQGEVLKIGMCATHEPMCFVNDKQIISGHDGELARRIGVKLGRPIEFVNMKFSALIPALQSGKVDLIVSGMSATEERAKSVNFTQSYFDSSERLIVNKAVEKKDAKGNNALKLKTVDDLKDKKIGVLLGSVHDTYVTKNFPKATVLQYKSPSELVLAVRSGKIDAAMYTTETLQEILRDDPDLKLLGDPLFFIPIGIGFNKDNDALREQFNTFLKKIKDDGIYDDMVNRWVTKGEQEMPVVEGPITNGTLTVGVVSDKGLPFTIVKDNRLIGFDVELTERFAAYLGMGLKWSDMEFGSLIAAVSTNKIDMITSTLMITEERKKQINFSDEYMQLGASIFALKKNIEATDTNPGKLKSLDDIADKRVGVYAGTIDDNFISTHYPNAEIKRFNMPADLFLALQMKKIDVFISDLNSAKVFLRSNPDIGILTEEVFASPAGYGFNKNDSKLRERFNVFLKKAKSDGTFDPIYKRWFIDDPEKARMPRIEFDEKAPRITLGVAVGDLPNSAIINNEHVGFDIELLKTFARYECLNMKIVTMEFSSLVPALASGKVDIIADSIAITEERKKQIDFSDSYASIKTAALALKENIAVGVDKTVEKKPATGAATLKLKTIDDLKDKRIGVLLGSIHDRYLTKNFPNATVLQYNSPPEIVLAVRSGKVDAALQPTETMQVLLKDDPDLKLFGDPVFSIPIAFGFKKNNDSLREQFNIFLKKIKEDGIFDDMMDRWVTKGEEEMPEVKNPKTNGTLIVGTMSNNGLPFTLVKDNRLIGLDVELAERFAAYIGKELKWEDMQFGSLIAAVSTNKIDMIATLLMVTEERKKQIDFSDEYMQLGSSFYALKKNIAAYESNEVDGAGDNKGAPAATSFFAGIINSFHNNIILEKRYLLILDGLKTTAVISILSIILGAVLGGLVCFMRMSRKKGLQIPARIFISILRGTPVLVILMIIFYVVFASIDIDPTIVAVLAFGLNFAAYVSEMFRTGIEGVDRGQTEAGIALGFTKIKTFIYIVAPQAIRRILPVFKGEVISLVKMTSIVGYIAVQDLTKASDIIRSRTFDAFFPLIMVAVLYFIISWLLLLLLEYVERSSDPKLKIKRGKS